MHIYALLLTRTCTGRDVSTGPGDECGGPNAVDHRQDNVGAGGDGAGNCVKDKYG